MYLKKTHHPVDQRTQSQSSAGTKKKKKWQGGVKLKLIRLIVCVAHRWTAGGQQQPGVEASQAPGPGGGGLLLRGRGGRAHQQQQP